MIRKLTLSIALLLAGHELALSQMIFPHTNSQALLEVIATNGAGKEKHLSSTDGFVPAVMVRPHQTVPVTPPISG